MSKKCYENSFQNSYINRCESRYENYENSERYGYNNRRPRAIIYGVNSRCNNNCRCGCKNNCGCNNQPSCNCCCECCCHQSTSCCSDAVSYALMTIQQNLNNQVTVNTSNSSISGVIGNINNNSQVVQIGNTYVSLANIVSMSFNAVPDTTQGSIYNCPTSECNSNREIARILRNIVGTTLPSTTNFTLRLTGNNLSFLTVNTVYGICNGILWAQAQALGQIGQMYMAIPLCSITTINGVSIADLNF